MKVITLWQPWASFMNLDLKKNETRSLAIRYRGPLAIHAAKTIFYDEIPSYVMKLAIEKIGPPECWPLGKILCLRDLFEIEANAKRPDDRIEAMLGFYGLGRYAWKTRMLQVFDEPIPARGYQFLWNWDEKAQ